MGYENRPPNGQELAAMREEVVFAMKAGAFGLSSGLAYSPGCFCAEDELTALCRTVAELGGFYSTHMRSEGNALEKAVEEALSVAAHSGVRLQISHVKTWGQRNWNKIAWLKDRLFRAKDEGLDVACDRYPYLAGSTGLHFVLPNWAKEGGPDGGAEAAGRPADPQEDRRGGGGRLPRPGVLAEYRGVGSLRLGQ